MAVHQNLMNILVALCLLMGCNPIEKEIKREWRLIDLANEQLLGAWEMEGYGRLIEVSQDTIQVYHHVKDFCIADRGLVPAFSLYALEDGGNGLSLLYQDYGSDSEVLQTRIKLNKLQSLPEACTAGRYTSATPVEVFDLLWASFQEHYAFFADRGVDWNQQKLLYESRVSKLASVDSLFPVLSEMLAPLGDGHVNLYQGRDKAFNAGVGGLALRNRIVERWEREGAEGSAGSFVGAWHRHVQSSVYDVLDEGSLQSGAAGAVEWGTISGDVGYVRINRFSGLAGRGISRPAQLDTLHAALREMSNDFADKRMTIVDVSLNGGGMDPAAITVARYFADQPRHVLTKTIQGAHDTRVRLEPVEGFQFTKPVYLLTSEVTASAAEVFVLIMRAFPHVKHVGSKTRGGISGMLPKQLPQDFMVTISNEQVLDVEGNLYEGKGIPPTVAFPVFPDDSLYTGLANALRRLSNDLPL